MIARVSTTDDMTINIFHLRSSVKKIHRIPRNYASMSIARQGEPSEPERLRGAAFRI